MLIQTQIEVDQLVDIRLCLNSLKFALDKLSKIEEKNFSHIFLQSDYENLEKGEKALDALIKNS